MPDSASGLTVAVLAAGASHRLGAAKQEVLLAGKTLLRRSLELAAAVARAGREGSESILLVSGARDVRDEDIAGLDVRVLHNARWSDGRGSSLALAARHAAAADAGGLLVLLCDQYRLDAAALAPLLRAFELQPERPVAAGYAGTSGAPVIWPASFLPCLADGRRRGREWLDSADVTVVPLAAAAFDLDDAGHLEALRRFEEELGGNG